MRAASDHRRRSPIHASEWLDDRIATDTVNSGSVGGRPFSLQSRPTRRIFLARDRGSQLGLALIRHGTGWAQPGHRNTRAIPSDHWSKVLLCPKKLAQEGEVETNQLHL